MKGIDDIGAIYMIADIHEMSKDSLKRVQDFYNEIKEELTTNQSSEIEKNYL